MYSKTHWHDRVVDSETGEVIQEGTFMSAEHFNNMENGIAANDAAISGINNNIDTIETTLETGVGTTIGLTINQSTFVMKFALKNSEGTVLSEEEVDLPIESMIINAEYAADSKSLILTLQSGSTVTVPLSALINGLVNESRKVAGIDLKDDITVPELESALEVDKLKTNVDKIANHINGNLTDSDFAEDSTAVMTKAVPTGTSNYVAVKMIGGYTRKTVNLFDINSAPYITKVDDETFNMVNHTNVVMTGFKADTQYTFSGYAKNNVSGGNVRFRLRYTDGSLEDIIKVDGSEYVYRQVTSQAGKSISDMIGYYGTSGNATFKQFQVQEGTTATSYEPYGQLWNAPIESVSSVYSKNLFPKKAVNLSYNSEMAARLHIPAGNYVFSAIGSSTITINIIFKYIDGTSKTVSLGIESAKRTAVAVTLTDTVISMSSYVNGNIKIDNVQLEKGKAMTEYEPYHEATILVPDLIRILPDYGVGIDPEHCNWIDFENMVYHHDYTLYDLTGKGWTSDGNGVFHTSYPTNAKVKAYGICNNYTVDYSSNTPRDVGDMIVRDPTYNVMYVKVESGTSPDTTGTLLYYELADDKKELIDISDILYPIRCEAGGIITLNNEHSLDVPNTIIYKKEVPTT